MFRFVYFYYHVVYTDECAPAEKIIKYERVCQMFQRLGYRQHPQKSAYWYLRPSQLSHQNKDVVFPDVVLPRQHQNQKNPYLKALTELIDAARKSDNIPALIRYYYFFKTPVVILSLEFGYKIVKRYLFLKLKLS